MLLHKCSAWVVELDDAFCAKCGRPTIQVETEVETSYRFLERMEGGEKRWTMLSHKGLSPVEQVLDELEGEGEPASTPVRAKCGHGHTWTATIRARFAEAAAAACESQKLGDEWFWSTSEERFGQGPFDSRDAAVADAVEELGADAQVMGRPAARFWTARKQVLDGSFFPIDGSDLLEQIAMRAYEIGGEAAEGWPSIGDGDDVDELGAKVSKVVAEWIDEHDPPGFWSAVDYALHNPDGSEHGKGAP